MNGVKRSVLSRTAEVVVLGMLFASSDARAANRAVEPKLEGSWHFTVNVPSPADMVFQGLATFARGGGFVETDNNPSITSASAGYGSWVRKSKHKFAFTFQKFAFNPILQQPGIFKVNETIEVQGDTYTGQSMGFYCDITGGNCVEQGPATSSGTKIKAE